MSCDESFWLRDKIFFVAQLDFLSRDESIGHVTSLFVARPVFLSRDESICGVTSLFVA